MEPKASDSQVQKVEDLLSVKLPKEFKMFVKKYGGGYFAFTNIYSVNEQSDWFIVDQNYQIGLIKPHHFLAVSDNGMGDFYGFKILNGICESNISLYDHEINKVKNTSYNDLYDYLLEVGLVP